MYDCLKENTQKLYLKEREIDTGRVSFMLLKGHERLYQEIELPLLEATIGREFFARWVPDFDFIDAQYYTDANGYDLVTRDVFKTGSGAFSSSFYPINNSITISDFEKLNSLTVWNDRT